MVVVFRIVVCDVVFVRVVLEIMSLFKSVVVGGEVVVCEGVFVLEYVVIIKVSWVYGCCFEGVLVGNCTFMRVCENSLMRLSFLRVCL